MEAVQQNHREALAHLDRLEASLGEGIVKEDVGVPEFLNGFGRLDYVGLQSQVQTVLAEPQQRCQRAK